MRIIQLYDKLDRYGGAQSVVLALFLRFSDRGFSSFVSSGLPYEQIVQKEVVTQDNYIKFDLINLKKFSNSIVISHSRKMTPRLLFFCSLLRIDCKVIHVSHTIFFNKKFVTFYPEQIVAVSDAVKNNLIEYFGINKDRIKLIYNGLFDSIGKITLLTYKPQNEIKILCAGRIEAVKKQVEIVRYLSGKINGNIKIDFAGCGSGEVSLQKTIRDIGGTNFRYIGYHDNIPKLTSRYHYATLFSEKEGLGLTLVEACMAGRALIAKGSDGCEACAEVCHDTVNGFIVNDWDSFIGCLNSLEKITEKKYYAMCDASRAIFKKTFSEKRMIDQYIQLIENL